VIGKPHLAQNEVDSMKWKKLVNLTWNWPQFSIECGNDTFLW
jgi:hypothetical protein